MRYTCDWPLRYAPLWQVRFHSLDNSRTLSSPWSVELKARYLEFVGAIDDNGRRTLLGGSGNDAAPTTSTEHKPTKADGVVVDLVPHVRDAIQELFANAETTFSDSPWMHLFIAHFRVR